MAGALGARRFATIDPEEFYDFQSTRPQVKLVDGHARRIVWPEVELYEALAPSGAREPASTAGRTPPSPPGTPGREAEDVPVDETRPNPRRSTSDSSDADSVVVPFRQAKADR